MDNDIKMLLADTLLELSKTKKLENIKVKDILEASGVSRQTFYNHFLDKNALITWLYHKKVLTIWEPVDLHTDYFLNCVDFHRRLKRLQPFLAQACRMRGQNCLSDYMLEFSTNWWMEYLRLWHGTEELPEEVVFLAHYHARGAMAMTIQWILDGTPISPEHMAMRLTKTKRLSLDAYIHEGLPMDSVNSIKNIESVHQK